MLVTYQSTTLSGTFIPVTHGVSSLCLKEAAVLYVLLCRLVLLNLKKLGVRFV